MELGSLIGEVWGGIWVGFGLGCKGFQREFGLGGGRFVGEGELVGRNLGWTICGEVLWKSGERVGNC